MSLNSMDTCKTEYMDENGKKDAYIILFQGTFKYRIRDHSNDIRLRK